MDTSVFADTFSPVDTPYYWANEEIDEEEDPFAEDGGGESSSSGEEADEEEDPFAEDGEEDSTDDDPFADESSEEEEADEEEEEEEEFEIRTRFKQRYRLIVGYSDTSFASTTGNSNTTSSATTSESGDEPQRDYLLANSYQMSAKIQTSRELFHFVRLNSYFSQSYNMNDEQYTDEYVAQIREAYMNYKSGKHRLRTGAQIHSIAKLHIDSPIEVLNQGNDMAKKTLELDELKSPVFSGKYDYVSGNHVTTLFFAPFTQETPGTSYTNFQEESDQRDSTDDPGDRTVLKAHGGFTYQYSFETADIRIGLFHWFDENNDITWQDTGIGDATTDTSTATTTSTTTDTTTASTYKEEPSTVTFATLQLDVTVGPLVWKADMGYFWDKIFYSLVQKKTVDSSGDSDTTSDFTSVKARHAAFATSIEGKFGDLFLLGVYSYRGIYNVRGNSHILFYENEEEPRQQNRDLAKYRITLLGAYDFTDNLNMTLLYYNTWPYRETGVANIWVWKPGGGGSEFQLKIILAETEEQKMTDEKLEVEKYFLQYSYHF